MRLFKYHTKNYHGYNVKCSPFLPDYLAVATSKNYGLTGDGALFVLRQLPGENCTAVDKFLWRDALFDLSWSKVEQNTIATGGGDGTVQLWNTINSKAAPVVLAAHTKEVYGVDLCGTLNAQFLLSSSADESICLWDTLVGCEVNRFYGHSGIVYSALWSPHMDGVFSSIGADGNVRLWDSRSPDLAPEIIMAHNGDVLACDWSFLSQHIMASGGADSTINIWDLRNSESPVLQMLGHELAVRRVKFSPFHRNLLASVSYDFSTRFWDWSSCSLLDTFCYHTEFSYGLDFSLHIPDKLCDCGWDSLLHIYEDIGFT